MNEFLFLIPIAVLLFFGVISPGPSFLLISQTAMSKSRNHAIAASMGMGAGAFTFASLAIAGLSLLLEAVPWLYLGLKIGGGLYLFYLAYKLWRASNAPIDIPHETVKSSSYLKSFLVGLITQLSNPKTAIVFAGVFAAFLPADPPFFTLLLIPLIAFIIDAGWYTLMSIFLSTARAQKLYANYKIALNKLCAGFLGFVGIKLMVSQ